MNILTSSEIFYFTNVTDGVLIKQGMNIFLLHQCDIIFMLISVYKTAPESLILTEIFGKWNKVNDFFNDLRKVSITSRRRKNLHGAKLRASMVVTNDETLNHLEDYQ